MDEKTKKILEEVENRAKEIIGEKLVEVILYGSYARNDYDPESDMDVMLLVDDEEENLTEIDDLFTKIMLDLSLRYDVLVSIFLKSYRQFNRYLNILPFYMNVRKEGITVYGRGA